MWGGFNHPVSTCYSVVLQGDLWLILSILYERILCSYCPRGPRVEGYTFKWYLSNIHTMGEKIGKRLYSAIFD